MKRLYFYLACLLVGTAASVQWSCSDIDGLSDENRVISFSITQHLPSTIQLGDVVIQDDDTIVIPIQYGSDKFPLSFMASIECDKNHDQIKGLDFSQMLTLESMESRLEFYVMAQSGLARRYVIKPQLTDYSVPEDIPFYVKSVSPEHTKILGKARITDDVMTLYVLEPEFPLSMVILFDVDENIVGFDGFTNGVTPLTFESADSEHRFLLSDNTQSSKRDITIRLAPVTLTKGSHDAMDIYQSDFKVSLSKASEEAFRMEGNRIDNQADSVSIYLSAIGDAANFPVSMTILIDGMGSDIGYIDFGSGVTSFYGFDQPQYFYMVNMEDQTARHWKLNIHAYKSEESSGIKGADVLSFNYDYTASNVAIIGTNYAAVLDKTTVLVYPDEGLIWLWMTAYNTSSIKTWSLKVNNLSMELSPGATTDAESFYWEGTGSWETPHTFEVTSAQGETRTWTLGIRDGRNAQLNDQTDILSVGLRSVYPISALLNYDNPCTIDDENGELIINMKSWDGCFGTNSNGQITPMRIYMDYDLSDGAHITSQDFSRQPLEFNSREEILEVVVVAENGAEQIWKASLSGPDNAGASAEVTSFRILSMPSDYFQLGDVTIDAANREVVITLNSAGSFPATIDYRMGVSRGASASIPVQGSVSFKNMKEVSKFTVSNSTESSEWSIRFNEFAPQIANWQLDEWSSNSPTPGSKDHPYWSTANYMSNTTTQVAGVTGSAAQLKTGSILGQKAAGSLFLGWFDNANAIANMEQPVKITFQGIEFAASKKIVAMEADIKYLSVMYDSTYDTGAITVELLKKNNSAGKLVYHGDDPETGMPHEDNNAVMKARGRIYAGNHAGTQGGRAITVVPSDSWTHIRINLDYSSMPDPLDYTHLNLVCGSSSNGDKFQAGVGSTLTIDNIKLIYEE